MPKSRIFKEKLYQLARELSPVITKSDIEKYYPDLSYDNYKGILKAMQKDGDVIHPWKSVYIIAPTEYFGNSEVHVSEYIDVIMRNAERGYYVALQDAISELIPSHITDQTKYCVIMDGKTNPICLGRTSPALSLSYSKSIPSQYTYTRDTKYGHINIASAELTAIDLVSYVNAVGGLQETVKGLKLLSPKLNFRRLKEDIFEYRSIANVQRLGYIIENVLGMPSKAQPLHNLLDKKYKTFYARHKLQSSGPVCVNINKRWNIDVNIDLK